mgnify:CR=1 FL=1
MYNSYHTNFILSPILNILRETVTACTGVGEGIETQSLCEYVLQTTFLKMTGASEQKLKCICWEIATYDYEYRHKYLRKNYGECSRYADKNSIYVDLKTEITKIDETFSISSIFEDIDISQKISGYIVKKAIKNQQKKGKTFTNENLQKAIAGMQNYYSKHGLCEKETIRFKKTELLLMKYEEIVSILDNSLLSVWKQHEYNFFKTKWEDFISINFATTELFDSNLQTIYETIVYNHRNRCAHNLTSYQHNLPTLQSLLNPNFDYENYFFRFIILILIDEIFMRLYRTFMAAIDGIV